MNSIKITKAIGLLLMLEICVWSSHYNVVNAADDIECKNAEEECDVNEECCSGYCLPDVDDGMSPDKFCKVGGGEPDYCIDVRDCEKENCKDTDKCKNQTHGCIGCFTRRLMETQYININRQRLIEIGIIGLAIIIFLRVYLNYGFIGHLVDQQL